MWDKRFGGNSGDSLFCFQQTFDGGYILGGSSTSGISGDKTQATWGGTDYWIVKIDSLGNKQWDKNFGGTNHDQLYSLVQTNEGGYILGGFSNSGIGGDKTQSVWGSYDYWIVKIDSLGNKQWDKDFGGTDIDWFHSIEETKDRGFILGGWSSSGINGDKTQLCWGLYDYWIVKIDSLGNKKWDKDFGGTDYDEVIGNVSQVSDDGYIVMGTSYSDISGDKTQNNLGTEQSWVIKIDSFGNKQWDKTLLTNSIADDEIGLAIQAKDGCFVMANFTDGGIGGDKTEPAWNGSYDFWIIKFCDSTILQSLFTSTPNLCPGICTDFTNLSFNASSYQWNFFGASPDTSTAINPTNICYATPGSYDVQLIASNPASGGSDTLLLTNYITVYPSPPPQSITQSGDTLFAIAGSASYQWYFNTNLINGATDYFYVAPASGDYNVVATDANGCEVEAAVFNVVASVNTSEDQEILIFPNPVGDKFTIQKSHPDRYRDTRETATEISIYNCLGEVVLAVPLQTSNCLLRTCSIDAHSLSPGLYYLEIKTSEKTFRSKFLKSTYR